MPRAHPGVWLGPVVTVTKGIKPLRMEDEDEGHGGGAHEHGQAKSRQVDDPHAWQSLANGEYIDLVAGLSARDPAAAKACKENARAYIAEIDKLDAEVRSRFAAISADHRKIVTTHDAFQYFGQAYGVEFIAPEGVSTEQMAEDVATLIRQFGKTRSTRFSWRICSDNRLIAQISKETSAKIGGTVYSDALSAADGPASSYLMMFRYNLQLTGRWPARRTSKGAPDRFVHGGRMLRQRSATPPDQQLLIIDRLLRCSGSSYSGGALPKRRLAEGSGHEPPRASSDAAVHGRAGRRGNGPRAERVEGTGVFAGRAVAPAR